MPESELLIGDLFKSIFDKLHKKHADELDMIRAQYPFEQLTYPDTPLVLHFTDAIKLLREAGDTEADEFTDISTPQVLYFFNLYSFLIHYSGKTPGSPG
jgi:aspartyl/asparaginyl-tRNA synthetase